jgi:alpha-N-arabinofuranosidase
VPYLSVDFADTVGRVSPRLYGAGFEHVGASVYGGAFVSENGDVPNESGWRSDVLRLARSLRPGLLRWPGGPFAQTYRWRDGVGPRASRPWRFDYYWAKPEPNLVGTVEFLRFCELVDAEPSITVNSRTGTPEEAAAWVEYCNGTVDTAGGRERAANGRVTPYNVNLWAIGSQSWELGPEDAARRYRAFRVAMKAVDPTIQTIAVGANPTNQDAWDRPLVSDLGDELEMLGVTGYDGVTTPGELTPADAHYANQAAAERLLWTFSNACQTLDEVLPSSAEAGVGLDGWGIWRISRQGLQHDYHLSDALVAAVVLNGLHRLVGRARFAAWGNLVNALGLIQATERSAWSTPVYEVLKLYRRFSGSEVVRSSVAGGTVWAPGGSSPVRPPRPAQPDLALLDVAATRDRAAGRYTLAVVNRSFDERQDTSMAVTGLPDGLGATAWTLSGDDVFAANTLAEPRRIEPSEVPIGPLGVSYVFPARSLTVLVWEETPGLT